VRIQTDTEAKVKAEKSVQRAAAKQALEERKAAREAAKAAKEAEKAAKPKVKKGAPSAPEAGSAPPSVPPAPPPAAVVPLPAPPASVGVAPPPKPSPPKPAPRPIVAPVRPFVPRPLSPLSPPKAPPPPPPVAVAPPPPAPTRSPFGLVREAPPPSPSTDALTRPVSVSTSGRPTPRAGASAPELPRVSKRERRDRLALTMDELTAPIRTERPERQEAIRIPVPITVKAFSQASGVKTSGLLKKLMDLGTLATLNHSLTQALVDLLGKEFNLNIEVVKERDLEQEMVEEAGSPDRPEDLKPRPPVVTFMGHVDHGKTSLLDRIRKTKVAAGEAGGITQHIGAYRVPVGDSHVVFLDTPGHEAFTAMRARGATITDVVVLVVASDDGVMPQTEEAYHHAKAAGVPIIVAINKIDKPGANAMRVLQQLSGLGLQPKEWGGNVECVKVSAVTGEGLDELLEYVSYVTELKELKANPRKPGRGTVLEAKLSEGRGVVAHVLVREGTLRRGDTVLCGRCVCKVRALHDDRGRTVAEAGPAIPVEIIGFSEMPEAGDTFLVMDDVAKAREMAEARARRYREQELLTRRHVTLETFLKTAQETGAAKELRVVLKVDVKGSLEVLNKAIQDLPTGEVKVRVLHGGVGSITEGDVLLADASDAVILGFHISPEKKPRALAELKGVEIRTYQVIYELIDALKKSMEGMLEPEARESIDGEARVLQTFKVSKVGVIAGCRVEKGILRRNSRIRLLRDGVLVHEGDLDSLKRIKDDVREVKEGFECGLKLHNFDDIKIGDTLQAYRFEQVARKLSASDAPAA
jgi:translation initiation factor IF-2